MDKLEKIASGIAHIFTILPSTPWWSFFSTLIGAIVGAVVAGLVAYYLARKTEKARQKAQIAGVMIKLMRIIDSTKQFENHSEEAVSEAETRKLSLFQTLLPMVGFSEKIIFAPMEMTTFSVKSEYKLIRDLYLIADQYHSLTASFKSYTDRRRELTDQWPATMKGDTGTVEFTEEELKKFGPRMHELDSHARQLFEDTKSNMQFALQVSVEFGPIARACLSDKKFPLIELINDTDR